MKKISHVSSNKPSIIILIFFSSNIGAFPLEVLNLPVASEQGLVGPSSDTVLESSPWGFDVQNIRVPTYLWFGRKDEIPFQGVLYLLANIGNLQKSIIVGSETHTMVRRYWRDIMETVVTHPESNSKL